MPAQVAPSLAGKKSTPSTSPPPVFRKPQRTLLTQVQGGLFMLMLLFCGLYVCWLILPFFLLLLLFDVPLAQRVLDLFIAAYLTLPVCLLESFGIRFSTHGDAIPRTSRSAFSLLLSNHPTTADWMLLWPLHLRHLDLTQLKIVLKGELRHTPVIGWALQMACHLFLHRKWEDDQHHVQRLIRHYRTAMSPSSPLTDGLFRHLLGRPSLQLLIFPEGTNLRPESSARSNTFAAEHGQPAYTHVLHPRTTGFTYILEQLTSPASAPRMPHAATSPPPPALESVYDLTVAFPLTRIRGISELFQGYFPDTVAVHCRRYPVSSLPTSAPERAAWLQQRYADKEALLARVYSLSSTSSPSSSSSSHGWAAFGPAIPDPPSTYLILRVIAAAWVVFAGVATWLMVSVWWLKWYGLACSVAFVLMTLWGGGDELVLRVEEAQHREWTPHQS